MRRTVAFCLLLAAMLTAAMGAHGSRITEAQSTATAAPATPVPAVSVSLLAQVDLGALATGSSTMRFGSLTLPAGSQAQSFTTPGPMVIVVQTGTLTLDAAAAIVGPPPGTSILPPVTPTPAPVQNLDVAKGLQVQLAGGVATQLRNLTDKPVNIFIISFTAPGGAAGPVPTAAP